MKICFIEPHLKLVGGIRRILEVSNRLMNIGHEVSIYTPNGRQCRWMVNKVPVKSLAQVTDDTFDVTIFNLADQYKIALSTNAKVKVFWALAPEALYKDPTIPLAALRPEFKYMVNSAFSAQYVNERIKLNYDVPIIPGGINTEHFKYDPTIPKEFHLLYYGSARPWKGTAIIEQAISGLRLKTLKMEGLNTPQERMYTLYNKCTMFVSAAQAEGFNFPILEAMSCGCPTVCTDDGGSRDFVRSGFNALVVPRTPAGLIDGINKVLSNKPIRRQFAKNGLVTARQSKFKWSRVTLLLEETLQNFLSGATN